jgi:predicted metal-binding membrane protein
MGFSPIEALLKRERAIVLGALAALAALAWVYLYWLAAGMDAMPGPMPDMPGMVMEPATRAWSVGEYLLAFAMWSVMMIGMMTPSAAPMILIYARVGRQAAAQGKPLAPTFWFFIGYLVAWCGFALVAALAQAMLLQLRLLTPMLQSEADALTGVLLIGAGAYQWTPFKDACLMQCQAPVGFIQRHGGFKRSGWASLRLGLKHGLYCVGCCWALMALLFAVGVMNLVWIAALSAWVLLEKIVPLGRVMVRALGLVLIVSGVIFLATGL